MHESWFSGLPRSIPRLSFLLAAGNVSICCFLGQVAAGFLGNAPSIWLLVSAAVRFLFVGVQPVLEEMLLMQGVLLRSKNQIVWWAMERVEAKADATDKNSRTVALRRVAENSFGTYEDVMKNMGLLHWPRFFSYEWWGRRAPHYQLLTGSDVSRITKALEAWSYLTRGRTRGKPRLDDMASQSVLRGFGIEVLSPEEYMRVDDPALGRFLLDPSVGRFVLSPEGRARVVALDDPLLDNYDKNDSRRFFAVPNESGHHTIPFDSVMVVLRCSGVRPCALNVCAMEEAVYRAKDEDLHDVLPAMPTCRPGWMVIDLLTVLAHILVVALLSLPLLGLGVLHALAFEPYSPISPLRTMSRVYLGVRSLSFSKMLFTLEEPLDKICVYPSVVLFFLLVASVLHSYCTDDLPPSLLRIVNSMNRVDRATRKAAPEKRDSLQRQPTLLPVTGRAPHFWHLPLLWFTLVLRVVPWLCVLLVLIVAPAYMALAGSWLLAGLVVDTQRCLPIATTIAGLVLTVARRIRSLRLVRRDTEQKLQQMVEAGVGDLLSSLVLKLGHRDTDSDMFKRLQQGKGSLADFFHLLTETNTGKLELETLERALGPLLSEERLKQLTKTPATLSYDAFFSTMTAVLKDVASTRLEELGLSTVHLARYGILFAGVATLLFTFVLVVAQLFPKGGGSRT